VGDYALCVYAAFFVQAYFEVMGHYVVRQIAIEHLVVPKFVVCIWNVWQLVIVCVGVQGAVDHRVCSIIAELFVVGDVNVGDRLC